MSGSNASDDEARKTSFLFVFVFVLSEMNLKLVGCEFYSDHEQLLFGVKRWYILEDLGFILWEVVFQCTAKHIHARTHTHKYARALRKLNSKMQGLHIKRRCDDTIFEALDP